jgi:hypothetical protein
MLLKQRIKAGRDDKAAKSKISRKKQVRKQWKVSLLREEMAYHHGLQNFHIWQHLNENSWCKIHIDSYGWKKEK